MAFHVPPHGRITDHPTWGSTAADGNNGAFLIASFEPGWQLLLICSDGLNPADPERWEHVSVHAVRGEKSRTPSWREMHYVKTRCWDDDDVVMQLHPAQRDYVNCHPHTLHLWRPLDVAIPTPPKHYV